MAHYTKLARCAALHSVCGVSRIGVWWGGVGGGGAGGVGVGGAGGGHVLHCSEINVVHSNCILL